MSELKAVHAFDVYEAYTKTGDDDTAQVYLKSEADKVIAELKETLKNSRNARKYWRKEYLFEYKECCHQKYKRCLAMANWCKSKQIYLHSLTKIYSYKELWEYASDYWIKWSKRWLKIAEQFKDKEAK